MDKTVAIIKREFTERVRALGPLHWERQLAGKED